MDKNLKFTDEETKMFYDMIADKCSIHFIDNAQISFKHLYNLWDFMYREEYLEEMLVDDIKPYRFTIKRQN
ncbi:hypothetical protein [Anaerosporobacter sp.]